MMMAISAVVPLIRGLNARWMGSLFAVLLIIAFGLVFNAVQANSIAAALHESFGLNKINIGITLFVVSGVIIFTGILGIARISEKIVPIIALSYLLIALCVVLMNLNQILAILSLIFDSAFGWKEAMGGVFGAMVLTGVQRGLFSNEEVKCSSYSISLSTSSCITRLCTNVRYFY